jgi:hypothetical protein
MIMVRVLVLQRRGLLPALLAMKKTGDEEKESVAIGESHQLGHTHDTAFHRVPVA